MALNHSCTWLAGESPEEQQRAEKFLFLLGRSAGARGVTSSPKAISSVADCHQHGRAEAGAAQVPVPPGAAFP